jgi:hypothetical protein
MASTENLSDRALFFHFSSLSGPFQRYFPAGSLGCNWFEVPGRIRFGGSGFIVRRAALILGKAVTNMCDVPITEIEGDG